MIEKYLRKIIQQLLLMFLVLKVKNKSRLDFKTQLKVGNTYYIFLEIQNKGKWHYLAVTRKIT